MDTSIEGRNIRLVDLPSIFDYRADSEHTNEHHFKILHDALEDGNPYVIFFVMSPEDGRISQFTVMKALLDSLDQSPLVGLILTKVDRGDYDAIQNSEYFSKVLQVLRQSKANLEFLCRKKPLILFYHSEKRFDTADSIKIKNYILGFEPRQVHARRLIAGVLFGIFHLLIGAIVGA